MVIGVHRYGEVPPDFPVDGAGLAFALPRVSPVAGGTVDGVDRGGAASAVVDLAAAPFAGGASDGTDADAGVVVPAGSTAVPASVFSDLCARSPSLLRVQDHAPPAAPPSTSTACLAVCAAPPTMVLAVVAPRTSNTAGVGISWGSFGLMCSSKNAS